MIAFGFSVGRNVLSRRVEGKCVSGRRNKRVVPSMIRGFPNEFNNNPNADGRERLIGELVDFPCVFTFKIIGKNEGDFVADILDSVSTCVNIQQEKLKHSFRDKGSYRSITLDVPCNSADQVYSIYAAIDRDPRVKFKF
uniref:DUF493 domain-containing protein n=1 Tax=Rhodosorus marinus TaxID=101924 RepID=A0A6T6NA82_9RHOD|mmetsp:Transcript_2607/g.3802  ORF Transcript_2607/g.3802 Transcript_2607/m.3802 type:complete len:139 (+) Transcript_2607:161-577(+)